MSSDATPNADQERASGVARHRLALVLLALLAAVMFAPAIAKQEVFTLRDHFDYFQPLRLFTAEELQAGRIPFWNPYNASGEPWFANPQTGVFYPPAWLFLALPFETAYMLFLLLHLVVLGWGAYLLFARSVSRGAAMVGAAALMFSGPVLSLLDVQNNLATLAWIPLALWCAAEGAWRRGGVVLALAFLGGEPFFAALGALTYAVTAFRRGGQAILPVPLVVSVGETEERPGGQAGLPVLHDASNQSRLAALLPLLYAALVAFGLTAIQLLPFLEYVARSDRAGGMEDALILRESMPLRDWLRIAVPPFGAPALGQQFIPLIYMGVLVVALALVGATTARRSRATRGWLVLLAFAIGLSIGPALLAHLPLTLFRYPARLVPIGAIAVAALAAAGWDRIRPNRRWVDLLLVLFVVADLLPHARPLLETAPFRRDVVPYPRDIGAKGKVLRFGEVDPLQRARWISGYLNLYDRRFDVFTAAPLSSERYVRMYRELVERPTFNNFAHAGVAFIVTKYRLPQPWFRVARAGDVLVYVNRDAFPMASHVSPGARALRFAPWTLSTNGARITVDAPRDGILVLRQQAGRGWRVTLDGKPAEALLIDGVFRGVSVPKGRHEVVWMYRPPFFFAGAAMTILTLLALAISLFVKRST